VGVNVAGRMQGVVAVAPALADGRDHDRLRRASRARSISSM
jgi:hypothetical protein